ncbi:hypothetical protein DNK73_02705 [Klebsiella pneumoniae]|nr:hypothetical protein DNK73_02705 [Klebsiella pneumoniae]RGC91216.1 hypothetical protein DIC67_26320 [Klebsiella pneumoniae]
MRDLILQLSKSSIYSTKPIYAIKFGFDVIKLTEISAVVRENHLASQKVLQKSGLRYVKEIHDVKDAPPSLLYSISVDEWLRNLEVNASV